MQVNKEKLAATRAKLTIHADVKELTLAKSATVDKLGKNVRLAGFRAGKAPVNLVEKNIDQAQLQNEVLQNVINQLYSRAAMEQKLRVVNQPEINITKFVPFTTLEFTAEVEVVGDVKLGNYKTIKLGKPKASVTSKDITDVLNNLNQQNAKREEVKRAAKAGDEVVIDFSGKDAGTNQKINGADGKEYPLILGSGQFIPGFEEKLAGLNAGNEKEFTLTFPKDYGVANLQNKKVTFSVNVKKVSEVKLGKIDDAWAKKVTPFKTLAELKIDIKKQLAAEKQKQIDQQYQQDVLSKVAEKSAVEIPKQLIDEEIERIENDEKQNLAYRGQTYDEHLAAEGVTAEAHKEQKRPAAEQRVKAGLVLTEIAEQENIGVTDDEVSARLQLLKGQYKDGQMQAELAKSGALQQIKNQLLTEKTFEKLVNFAAK